MWTLWSKKLLPLVAYGVPVALMIAMIPHIRDEYVLAGIYTGCVVLLYFYKHEKNDGVAIIFGLVGITLAEYFFISTGVETFTRTSLFGVMPLWLPILWAYAFLTIKRSLRVLDR